MPRRENLSDFEEDEDEAIIEKTKKKNSEKKTYVFEIKLSENANEKYEYNDSPATSMVTRKVICPSIYMGRDIRKSDNLELLTDAKDRLDLECVPCHKYTPDLAAKKCHDKANHPIDMKFLYYNCNTRVLNPKTHAIK